MQMTISQLKGELKKQLTLMVEISSKKRQWELATEELLLN